VSGGRRSNEVSAILTELSQDDRVQFADHAHRRRSHGRQAVQTINPESIKEPIDTHEPHRSMEDYSAWLARLLALTSMIECPPRITSPHLEQ
jgi:hypothetical protein